MPNQAPSPVVNCPTCKMPMVPDAAEVTGGMTKMTYHCIQCGTESERVAQAQDHPDSNQPTP